MVPFRLSAVCIFPWKILSFPYQVLALIGKGNSLHGFILKPADYNVKKCYFLFPVFCKGLSVQSSMLLMQIAVIFPAGNQQVTQSLTVCQQGILHFQQLLPDISEWQKKPEWSNLCACCISEVVCSFNFLIFIQCFARFNSLY